jgi:hypothetical protein
MNGVHRPARDEETVSVLLRSGILSYTVYAKDMRLTLTLQTTQKHNRKERLIKLRY